MNWIRIAVRALLSMLGALLVVVYFLEYDQRAITYIEQTIETTFEQLFECHARGRVVRFNLLKGEVELADLFVCAPAEPVWHWHAQRLVCSFSWVQFLISGRVDGRVMLDTVDAYSGIQNGTIGIIEHLQQLARGVPDLPISLKNVQVYQGSLTVEQPDYQLKFSTGFQTESGKIGRLLKTTGYCFNGQLTHDTRQLMSDMGLSWNLDIDVTGTSNLLFTAHGEGNAQMSQQYADDIFCHIATNANQDMLHVELNTKDESSPLINATSRYNSVRNEYDVNANLSFPFGYLVNQFMHVPVGTELNGMCHASVTGTVHCGRIRGNLGLQLEEVGCNGYQCGTLQGTGLIDDQQIALHGTLVQDTTPVAAGQAVWDRICNSGLIKVHNESAIPLWPSRYWGILAHDTVMSCTIDQSGVFDGGYQATMTHEKTGHTIDMIGTFTGNDQCVTGQGSIGQHTYGYGVQILPYRALRYLTCHDPIGNQLVSLGSDMYDPSRFEGVIGIEMVRKLIKQAIGYQFTGEGALMVQGSIDDTQIRLEGRLQDANIRLYNTHNVIHDGTFIGTYDRRERNLSIENLFLSSIKGKISSSGIRCWWDTDQNISFLQAPVFIEKLFLNKGKDLFVETSGYLLLTKPGLQSRAVLKGTVSIERGQLRKNIFSSLVHQSLASSVMGAAATELFDETDLQVHLTTSRPLSVRTSFLETNVHMDLWLHGTVAHPQLTGTITLLSGKLIFPYKPLYFNQGTITFNQSRANDPLIDLRAQGRIKNYTVCLQLGGSAQQPIISFSSTPGLTQEQIITLLLAGAQDGSLQAVVPSLIMKNMQSILFSEEQSPSKLETYFNNIIAPFRYVRIVPKFDDQISRGGFRWAIEIDMGERFHGLIQKNFSLSEDTRFEVEYLMSDDVSLRGIKDERSDLAGEIEMRWKY